jgi:hypothetical protein
MPASGNCKMPDKPKLTARDYYEFTPSLNHAPGDIWSDLSTYGMLSPTHASGLVITPACDLANRKVETVTYLPVIPVRAYVTTAAFLPELVRETNRLIAALSSYDLGTLSDDFPSIADRVTALEERASALGRATNCSLKDKELLERVASGSRLIALTRNPAANEAPYDELRRLFGESVCQKLFERIVRNAYSLDVHFLPADGQRVEWSGVPVHSVVLFRQPMSAPVQLFDAAQDLQLTDWGSYVDRLSISIPAAAAFKSRRPMKRVTMRAAFASDLITRFISMFVRLGSPDFSSGTIAEYVAHLGR